MERPPLTACLVGSQLIETLLSTDFFCMFAHNAERLPMQGTDKKKPLDFLERLFYKGDVS
jgi:hypothetical protein